MCLLLCVSTWIHIYIFLPSFGSASIYPSTLLPLAFFGLHDVWLVWFYPALWSTFSKPHTKMCSRRRRRRRISSRFYWLRSFQASFDWPEKSEQGFPLGSLCLCSRLKTLQSGLVGPGLTKTSSTSVAAICKSINLHDSCCDILNIGTFFSYLAKQGETAAQADTETQR